MLEIDVTGIREKLKSGRKDSSFKTSFIAWLICQISASIKEHESSAAYRLGKNKLIIFEDINVSLLVEKEVNGLKMPFPLVLDKTHIKTPEEITALIIKAKNEKIESGEMVLLKKPGFLERIYSFFPGFIRRIVWGYILRRPKIAFKKMGNVAITSIGGMGKVNAWFVPLSIHPICFGIGPVIKKPAIHNDKIEIREILNLTVLLDHDVIDGADMARFISALVKKIEKENDL